MDPFDALIVGGGPAGLAAAIALAGQGRHVLLAERRHFPLDKACGEGIMPTGVADLKELGVWSYLAAGDSWPLAGVRYLMAGQQPAAARFAEGPGIGLRRTALSEALLQRARALPSIELRPGVAAEPVAVTAHGVTARIGREIVTARLLIGADGLNSRVRQWAGLAAPNGQSRRWGVRQHFDCRPWSDHVEVHWAPDSEAYVTPVGPGQVNVAILWDRDRLGRLAGGRQLWPSLLAAFPELQSRLGPAAPVSGALAVGPLRRDTIRPVNDGVLLIGDAAGYLDPITGDGISLALAQALALARTVAPLLVADSRERLSRTDLAPYATCYRHITRPYRRLTSLALLMSRHPNLARGAIRLLAARPALFQHLLSANMGTISLWALPPFRRDITPVEPPAHQSLTAL
jgi:2-polyprenyl-6-methoxyphenol hydroxylase-like FAD-dependent oxidoreductase